MSLRERKDDKMNHSAFIGDYSAKVDDKGRLVFPADLKCSANNGSEPKFVVHKDIYQDCLEVYSFEDWQEMADSVLSKLDLFNPNHANFWRKYMQDSAVVTPDPKLGRILIPNNLKEMVGLTKDVIFAGKGFKIEIWDAERYRDQEMSVIDYQTLAQGLSQKR